MLLATNMLVANPSYLFSILIIINRIEYVMLCCAVLCCVVLHYMNRIE